MRYSLFAMLRAMLMLMPVSLPVPIFYSQPASTLNAQGKEPTTEKRGQRGQIVLEASAGGAPFSG